MKSATLAIHVAHLSKLYEIGSHRRRLGSLKETLTDAVATRWRRLWGRRGRETAAQGHLDGDLEPSGPNRDLWALRDVSFEINRGDVVGVIGRNGSGKSTLLKVLARITAPTQGRAELYGRVGSLLEVGTGFHPDLTGRDNIYLSGVILGMRRAEVRRKFDQIVAFAELERFIDTPVKRYSSGMYVRLAFAVAAFLEADILLVDEVLAVGDLAFQTRCLSTMNDMAQGGRTVLFVSHDLASVEHLCKRVILMEKGRLARQGDVPSVVSAFLQTLRLPQPHALPLAQYADRSGNGRIRLTSFHVEDEYGNPRERVHSGMDVVLVLGYRSRDGDWPQKVDVGLSLCTPQGQVLAHLYQSCLGQVFDTVPPAGFFRCRIPHFPFSVGEYRIHSRVTVDDKEADRPADGIGDLVVESGDFYGTGSRGMSRLPEGTRTPMVLVKGGWEVEKAPEPAAGRVASCLDTGRL